MNNEEKSFKNGLTRPNCRCTMQGVKAKASFVLQDLLLP